MDGLEGKILWTWMSSGQSRLGKSPYDEKPKDIQQLTMGQTTSD